MYNLPLDIINNNISHYCDKEERDILKKVGLITEKHEKYLNMYYDNIKRAIDVSSLMEMYYKEILTYSIYRYGLALNSFKVVDLFHRYNFGEKIVSDIFITIGDIMERFSEHFFDDYFVDNKRRLNDLLVLYLKKKCGRCKKSKPYIDYEHGDILNGTFDYSISSGHFISNQIYKTCGYCRAKRKKK
jgi:hypothetical protein